MKKRAAINNLLVGPKWIESRIVYKQAILRGQLALLAGIICLIYLIVDPLRGSFLFLNWYAGYLGVVFAILYLNRLGRYTLSSSLLIISANIIVFFLAGAGLPGRGVYMYFMSIAIASLVLFYHDNLKLGLVFVVISTAAALLAYLGDFKFFYYLPDSENFIKVSFTLNFVIGLLTVVSVVLIIIKRNQESEQSLLNSTHKLQQLTRDLEQSRNRYSMAVESSKAGIYEWDIKNNKVYVSSRWRQLHGFDLDEKLGGTFEFFIGLVHPDDREMVSSQVEQSMKRGGSYQIELRMRNKAGEYQWFLDSGIVKLDNGTAHLAVGSIIDISDRKKAVDELTVKNKELEKANSELDKFVYSASHDIRAPLSTLTGLISIAKITKDPQEHLKYFDMMTSRIRDMEGFIRDITDYSRNARLEVEFTEVSLKSMLEELKESFDFLAKKDDINIIIEVVNCREILSDEFRLKIVLNNIMSNAIKYFNPDKEDRYVKVWIEPEDKLCRISIEDNGLGIAKEYQDKIFDMFYRASADSSGSGLGLYIVKETLAKINGNIKFDSKPGIGSTFTIEIPLDAPVLTTALTENIKSI